MVKLTPANISGLVVGEGCFYVESCGDPKYRLGWRIRPSFCIEMRADDAPVLEAVKQSLGCGNVYRLDFGRYKGYENRGWVPHAKYRVTRLADLQTRVVPFFQVYELFGRKARAFELFAAIVAGVARGDHRDAESLPRMKGLARELASHNGRGLRSLPSR